MYEFQAYFIVSLPVFFVALFLFMTFEHAFFLSCFMFYTEAYGKKKKQYYDNATIKKKCQRPKMFTKRLEKSNKQKHCL